MRVGVSACVSLAVLIGSGATASAQPEWQTLWELTAGPGRALADGAHARIHGTTLYLGARGGFTHGAAAGGLSLDMRFASIDDQYWGDQAYAADPEIDRWRALAWVRGQRAAGDDLVLYVRGGIGAELRRWRYGEGDIHCDTDGDCPDPRPVEQGTELAPAIDLALGATVAMGGWQLGGELAAAAAPYDEVAVPEYESIEEIALDLDARLVVGRHF